LPQGNGSRGASLVEIEGCRMSIFDPPPNHYTRHCARVALRGESAALPLEREAEPSNVSDIRAARTMRAVRLLRGRDALRERPL
jgi:hypothetical protein